MSLNSLVGAGLAVNSGLCCYSLAKPALAAIAQPVERAGLKNIPDGADRIMTKPAPTVQDGDRF
ncbi:hypothetical protein [Leptolyngbya sp. FACHB-16]|uniref:hypothetical protein n=1 Tax=unclassified Leptolyngbya TaxID=2650499 RepID=UPI001685A44C|nr:hypothetical protein [Leptolyngbya sp. FACHB-16]MBD2157690.1 hypothetical protein [Leptolyngbya sp. FACHB-16]